MRSTFRRRALALLAATFLAFVEVAGVLANASDPTSISASVDGDTVTVSGSWNWTGIDKCDGHWVGWAVDWNDPEDGGNAVTGAFSVGTAGNNAVHTGQNCGSAINEHDRSGSWGALSHTYSGPGTYTVCAVMYTVTNKGDVPLSDVKVVDDQCSPDTGPTGDVNADAKLDLTESWAFSGLVMLVQTSTNTAIVSATYDGQTIQAMDMATVTVAAAPPPPFSEEPSGGAPGDSGAGAPGASGGPGSSAGPAASGGAVGPGGSVAGATSPVKTSPDPDVNGFTNPGTTPSAMVMVLILLLGVAASVVIMTLSKRTSAG